MNLMVNYEKILTPDESVAINTLYEEVANTK